MVINKHEERPPASSQLTWPELALSHRRHRCVVIPHNPNSTFFQFSQAISLAWSRACNSRVSLVSLKLGIDLVLFRIAFLPDSLLSSNPQSISLSDLDSQINLDWQSGTIAKLLVFFTVRRVDVKAYLGTHAMSLVDLNLRIANTLVFFFFSFCLIAWILGK